MSEYSQVREDILERTYVLMCAVKANLQIKYTLKKKKERNQRLTVLLEVILNLKPDTQKLSQIVVQVFYIKNFAQERI